MFKLDLEKAEERKKEGKKESEVAQLCPTLSDPMDCSPPGSSFHDVGNLISVSFAFSKSSLNIWKFLVHLLLKSGLKDFEQNLASM